MTVLITGGTGFVGLALAEQLRARGRNVRLFAPSELPDALARAAELDGVETVLGDVRCGADLAVALDGVSHVAHLAAVTPDAAAEARDPATVMDVNVTGTATLLHAMSRHARDARLLLGSSVAVYGTAPPEGDRYGEAQTPAPTSLYGISKRAAEDVATRLAELYGMRLLIARIGPVFGPWEQPSALRPLLSPHGQILACAARGEEAVLPRPMAGDWLYSRDAGHALASLLDAPDPPHRIYNIGGDQVNRVDAWAGAMAALRPGLRWRLAEPGESPNVRLTLARDRAPLDVARLCQATGRSPGRPVEAAAHDHHAWLEVHAAQLSPN